MDRLPPRRCIHVSTRGVLCQCGYARRVDDQRVLMPRHCGRAQLAAALGALIADFEVVRRGPAAKSSSVDLDDNATIYTLL